MLTSEYMSAGSVELGEGGCGFHSNAAAINGAQHILDQRLFIGNMTCVVFFTLCVFL